MRNIMIIVGIIWLNLLSIQAFSSPNGWTHDRRLTNNVNQSHHPTITCDALGNSVFVAWTDHRDGFEEIYFKRSYDKGLTWSAASNISNQTADSSSPHFCWYANTLVLTWLDYRGGSSDVYAMKSIDNGTTWLDLTGTPGQVTNVSNRSNTGTTFSRPFVTLNPMGTHVVWADNSSGNSRVYYRNVTVAATLSLKPDSLAATLPAIATLNYGSSLDTTLYVVWEESPGANSSIFFSQSIDGGVTWTDGTGAPGAYDISFKFSTCSARHPYVFVSSDTAAGVDVGFIDNRQGADQIYWEAGRNFGLPITWDAGSMGFMDAPNTITSMALLPDGFTMSPRNSSGQTLVWSESRDGNNELYRVEGMGGGNIAFLSEVRLTTDAGDSIQPAVVANDNYLTPWLREYLVWADNRDGNYEIYFKSMDQYNPDNVIDLAATTGGNPGEVNLQWTSPADDVSDPVWYYDIRYNTSVITNITQFRTNGTPIAQTITPLPAGQIENFTVTGLSPGSQYYFAMISVDQAGNSSNVSNSPNVLAGLAFTATPTSTISATVTPTYTISATQTISATTTVTPTISITRTITPTPTISATSTITLTSTFSATHTSTSTATGTPDNPLLNHDLGNKSVLAYPLPAKNQVRFLFHLARPTSVKIHVYNLNGEQVANLNSVYEAGQGQTMIWNCGAIASGLYMARVFMDNKEVEKLKIIIMK